MNNVIGVSAAASSSAPASITDQTIDLLQAQMLQYISSSGVPPGSADFKAFQYALDTGNIVSAQAALSRLVRDNQAAPPTQMTQASAPAPTAEAVSAAQSADDADSSGSLGTEGGSLDATA